MEGSDGLSCSSPSSAGTCIDTKGNPPKNFQSLTICSDAISSSPFRPQCDDVNPCLLSQGDSTHHSGCLQFGTCASGGLNCIYPSDFIPFTRRPLYLVIDSDNSKAFKLDVIGGGMKRFSGCVCCFLDQLSIDVILVRFKCCICGGLEYLLGVQEVCGFLRFTGEIDFPKATWTAFNGL
ncbi:hypothetical protein CJ030_MR2G013115 [Morella rubra]|uniref:Uncharacterized protein n=1 Tax=Morella rubra TaxID=262757 RepID=A0A6A1WCG9_9ROSI|nr:hypothetical protein CJ030_MR2G013112 [Morella rubra]KAB1221391.1 hypothetical protein CJ030_MR2G013115 [Morella rubra]